MPPSTAEMFTVSLEATIEDSDGIEIARPPVRRGDRQADPGHQVSDAETPIQLQLGKDSPRQSRPRTNFCSVSNPRRTHPPGRAATPSTPVDAGTPEHPGVYSIAAERSVATVKHLCASTDTWRCGSQTGAIHAPRDQQTSCGCVHPAADVSFHWLAGAGLTIPDASSTVSGRPHSMDMCWQDTDEGSLSWLCVVRRYRMCR